jgi:hypothetical protein
MSSKEESVVKMDLECQNVGRYIGNKISDLRRPPRRSKEIEHVWLHDTIEECDDGEQEALESSHENEESFASDDTKSDETELHKDDNRK